MAETSSETASYLKKTFSKRQDRPSQNPTEWGKTRLSIERIKSKGLFEEPAGESKLGFYGGRRIIGKDTPIQGGVYLLPSGTEEAIVVDESIDLFLNSTWDRLMGRYYLSKEKSEDFNVLGEVYELTINTIPYVDDESLDQLHSDYQVNPDDKVSLGLYIEHQGGQCRHQALLSAYLLERMIKNKIIKGTVSVDKNYDPDRGGHAWARLTQGKDVYVIDTALGFWGNIKDVEPDEKWWYERPKPKLWKMFGKL